MATRDELPDRQGIHAELERVRADMHQLVTNARARDLRRRTNGTRWTNAQMLWHRAFGYLLVRRLLLLVRLPDFELPSSVLTSPAHGTQVHHRRQRIMSMWSRPDHAACHPQDAWAAVRTFTPWSGSKDPVAATPPVLRFTCG